ncbi:MAG TPA: hypothetical protein VF041_12070 [Gemmatimonadaceae bacterium]
MRHHHSLLAALLALAAVGCAPHNRRAPSLASAGASAAPLAPTGGYRGRFNNDRQSHADFCVRLRAPTVALRYADGEPTGFSLTDSILRPAPGTGVSCPEPGLARLDAREIVMTADGRPMLFHRGGWGFVGNDPASAVHYGHVLLSDIDSVGLRFVRDHGQRSWVPAPTAPWPGPGQLAGNGTACEARSPTPSRVAARSIPGDMRYLNSARTAAIPYAIYGSPAEDLGPAADRARGVKYTMLTWSWINVRGGGVARALIEDGASFYPCTDVPPIRLASVSDARTRTITGWVEAVYGAIRSGDGWLYGWIVSAHRHGADPVVAHLVR